jgi:hypothetical protein
MASGRSIVRWAGVVLIIAGFVAAVTPLAYGYAPLSAPAWWSFDAFWGGIAGLIVGVAAVLAAQYAMEVMVPPYESRQKMQIPA